MIELPDFSKAFEHENNFYLSCRTQRISKFVAHYELFKQINHLTGEIVECGVFKGTSLVRWAHFREMMGHQSARKIIGFDIFGTFPATTFEADQEKLEKFVTNAGDQSIDVEQLHQVLDNKKLNTKIELVKGDINQTVPDYVANHPELRIAMLNLDTDIYEPAVTILEHLYPRIVSGGILILDDYGVFPGETKAVDDYFKGQNVVIRKMPYANTPSYIIKP